MNKDGPPPPPIKHLSPDFGPSVELYLSGECATKIWLALENRISANVFDDPDPLSEKERKLYDALTEKFAFDASFLGVEATES